MTSFHFRGVIADVDETTPDEPCHPATVIIVRTGEEFSRVVVPDSVLTGRRELLCAERPIHVFGEVRESRYGATHVATQLRLTDGVH